MQMIAIRLCKENLDTILTTTSIDPLLLQHKLKTFGPDSLYGRALGYKYYYIPWGALPYALDAWQFCRDTSFTEKYIADMNLIENQFVRIIRK